MWPMNASAMEHSALHALGGLSVPHQTMPQPAIAAAWPQALGALSCSYIFL